MRRCVLTYLVGECKDELRTPAILDDDCDYICVTDNETLTSNVWTIKYDKFDNCITNRDKLGFVKLHPTKWTDASEICIIDATHKIDASLYPLFATLDEADIVLKKHTIRNNVFDELMAWRMGRGMSDYAVKTMLKFAIRLQVNPHVCPLYESCVMFIHNNKSTIKLFTDTYEFMNRCGENGSLFISNQIPLSILLGTNNYISNVSQLNTEPYFTRYYHNSNRINKT